MPTTDTAPQCTVGGGSGSTEAHFLDMRTTATRLDTSGDDARHLCTSVVRIGLSLPAKSAILSPGSALRITEQIAALTVDLGGLALRMEFVARTLRWSATAYELADATQRAAFAALTIATTPQRLLTDIALAATDATLRHPTPPPVGSRSEYGAALIRNGRAWTDRFTNDLQHEVSNDPALVDGSVAWTSFLMPAVVRKFPALLVAFGPAPDDYEGQIGWLLASGQKLGWFADSKPLQVKQTGRSSRPARQRQLSDIVGEAATTEHQSDSDHSVVHVRRVVGTDGKGAWVVSIPGTTHWDLTSDHGPSSTAANLASMAGTDHTLYPAIDKAVTAAMREAGVRPGSEPVMMAGHSQGGIVATRLAADPHFRDKFDVTEVVTAGSPIGRITVPKSVNVLSVENIHDPVPRADGVPNPDATNRTNIVCETPKGEKLHGLADAHDASRYARSSQELTPDRAERQLSQWYTRNHRFLDGTDTDFTFQLRRP
ncbi:hypothetical protein [Flexivirga sp.]|uniref:hypothetical protein n=1 Tax=Flexivirga sp. TaxID=1962927 RepID=UPI003F7D4147